MRVLVLGGTRFVGRHFVAGCLARGDDVTVMHRGQSPSPFVDVARHVRTDRRALTAEAEAALAEPWEAVVDTSASDLADVRATTVLLRDVGAYVFLSSCGVYSRRRRPGAEITELSATIRAAQTNPLHASAAAKLRCERFLRRHLERAGVVPLILRLGLVVGAYDYSDRLAYWLERALSGGDMLVPMDPDQPISLVDAADVAWFIQAVLDKGLTGVVNLAGRRTTARMLVDAVVTSACGGTTPCWVDEAFALAHRVRPWTQVPLWLPAGSAERTLMNISSARAEESGLRRTPLADTVTACLAWRRAQRGWSQRWLDRTKELDLIRRWHG
jgi:2'-hydroxyisoflavone reductase